MRNIRVVIAEDYTFFTDTLKQLLSTYSGIELVGEASAMVCAVEAARTLEAHVLVIDIKLLGEAGLDAICEIRSELPQTQIVVIGDEDEKVYSAAAHGRGAAAYVVKSAMCHQLVPAIIDSCKGA
ncbi:MAG: response regulator transcription factor [Chloroflexi bacterium]|nr:response regulator transcription factor [Chloroflexota bacterium]